VTGPRDQLPPDLPDGIRRIRALTQMPVAVGFGISTPAQAEAVAAVADAVIVGSAIVAAIDASQGRPDLVARTGGFLADLRCAIR
jgi:tryptophan synthase alpha chain